MSEHQFSKLEMGSTIYKPLYPPEGGPLGGFLCVTCNAVTRTRKGMILHLGVVHGIRLQLDLKLEPISENRGEPPDTSLQQSDPGWTPVETK